MSTESDKLARAYARLRALRDNLPTHYRVKEPYVREYHEALNHLEGLGFDVEEFRVPKDMLARVPIPTNIMTGETKYGEDLKVERTFLLSKLDAVLAYFELVTRKVPTNIGFRPPSE